MEIAAEILAHYAEGQEHARLTRRPLLELLRTRVLLERFVPAPPARVLDIGGASGVYASWLSGRGYQVHLIDPVPLHREQAMADGRFSVASGDARHLAEDDGSYDAVLLLGPLYHLTDRSDRVGALAEARRVTRPGGIVAAGVISRYASTFDGFFRGFIDTPGFTALMTDDLKTGQHRNPGSDPGVLHHRLLPRQSGHRQRNNRLGAAPAGPAAHRGPAALGTRHPGPAQRPRPAAAHPRQKGCGVPAVIASRQDYAMLAGRPFLVCAGGPLP